MDALKVTGRIVMVDKTFNSFVVFTVLDGTAKFSMIAPSGMCTELVNALQSGDTVEIKYNEASGDKTEVRIDSSLYAKSEYEAIAMRYVIDQNEPKE